MDSVTSHCQRRCWALVLAILGFATVGVHSALALDPAKKLSQYVHENWTVQQGLPTNDIQTITQTRDGYLWIGTEEGLARFDGARFDVFDKASGKLPGNYVFCLLEDSDGRLWIGCDGGLARYQDGEFQTVGVNDGLAGAYINQIVEDEGGAIWINGNNKLYRYRANSFVCFDPSEQQIGLGRVTNVAVDKANTVWVILNAERVCRFQANRFEPVPELAMLKGRSLERISPDAREGIWISDFSGGIYHYEAGRLTAFGQDQGLVSVPSSRVILDRDQNVWLGVEFGIARIVNGKCRVFHSSNNDVLGQINAVYEDREGNLWAGSNGRGLWRFTDGSFTALGPEEGLPDDTVRGGCEDSDRNLWLGASDGIYRGPGEFIRVLSARDQLGGDLSFVQLLGDPRDHSLWIGTTHGLFHYYYQTQALIKYTTSDGLPSNATYSLCLDKQGGLWIGCENGLVCLRDGKFMTPEVCQRATRDLQVVCLAEDHAGVIWIGTRVGPMRYEDGAITQFTRKDGLGAVMCTYICVGSDGTVWISTWNGGISRFTGDGFFTYLQRDGLPDDMIIGIVEDPARGDLWLGSDKGVFRIGLKQLDDFRVGKVKQIFGDTFGLQDGLPSPGIDGDGRPIVIRAHDGKLWWCLDEGAAVVDPGNLVPWNASGPVIIENVIADDRLLVGRNPTLDPGTRHLEIEFASLSYAAPDRVHFRYRLEGVDGSWFNARQRRVAVFTNLRPGHYHFRVQASADRGVTWNSPSAEIGFYVQPHFYETRWFFALCVAVGVGLIWLAFVLRRLSIEAHFRAVIAERVKVAGEIHDSLAQGFASAAMLLDSMDRKLPQDSALQQRLKSVRSILGTSLSDARAMIATLRGKSPEDEDLEQALRKLVQRLEPVSPAPITLDFGESKPPAVSDRVRQELMRICQEGINNAIQHANARKIWIKLGVEERGQLRLVVSDDGKGFSINGLTNSPGTHFGLIGMRERAQRIGAQLEIRSQLGKGTELELTLPRVEPNIRKSKEKQGAHPS